MIDTDLTNGDGIEGNRGSEVRRTSIDGQTADARERKKDNRLGQREEDERREERLTVGFSNLKPFWEKKRGGSRREFVGGTRK